jgi:succinoglycan biosynthesis transport protein ExoP
VESAQNQLQQQTLQDYLAVLLRRKWAVLITFGVVVTLAVINAYRTTPIFRAQARLLVEASDKVPTVRTGDPLLDLHLLAQPRSIAFHLMEIKSGPFLSRVFSKLRRPRGTRSPRLTAASAEEYASLIEVTAESTDGRLAASAANLAVDEYPLYSRETSLKEVRGAERFVTGECSRARQALADAERNLLAFRRDLGVPQLAAEQESRTRQVLQLEQRLEDNATSLARVAAQVDQVEAELNHEPAVNRMVSERANPRRDALEGRLVELETQRAALLAEYREGSPMLASVDAQIKRAKQQVAVEPAQYLMTQEAPNPVYDQLRTRLQELNREQRGLKVERHQLVAQLPRERERADRLLPREVRLTALTAARDKARKLYQMMDEKLQDLALLEQQWIPTARVFEYAGVPSSPFKPRKRAAVMMAALIGLILGLAAAFLLETLDDRVTSPEQVERDLGLPVMGYLPLIRSRPPLLMQGLPVRGPIVEGYRALRLSISFAAAESPLRTIVVSSSEMSEGKSLTATNLAITMALDGRRVILVDADLRRPALHRLLDLEMSPGLTDVLLGKSELSEALRPFPGVPRLQIMTCGDRAANPAELLGSAQMTELIDFLAERVDVVVFDCPPCLPVTDATLLSTKVDGVLLVAAIGKARRAGLRSTKDQFDRARARLLGLVFNKVQGSLGKRYPYCDPRYHDEDGNGMGLVRAADPVNGKRLENHLRTPVKRTPMMLDPPESTVGCSDTGSAGSGEQS